MRKAKLAAKALAFLAVVGGVTPAVADHNDSTPIGLRITVTNVDPISGEVEFDITVVDDSITDGVASAISRPINDIVIGQRFTYDRYTTVTYDQYVHVATNVTLPPAIDFGDGQTVPFTRLNLVSDITTDPGTFRGSFSHTYTTPGNFTITAFAANAYGVALTEITTGNAVSVGPLNFGQTNIANTDSRTDSLSSEEAVGISNTAQVAITGGVSQATTVPTLGRVGAVLFGLALAGLGTVLLRRLG